MYHIELKKEYFHFCAAHFIVFNATEREMLHGHNYYVSMDMYKPDLMNAKLIDISLVKPVLRKLCDELDHLTLFPDSNEHLTIHADTENVEVIHNGDSLRFPATDVKILPIENTTMECLAEYLLNTMIDRFPELRQMDRLSVTVQETNGQKASYEVSL